MLTIVILFCVLLVVACIVGILTGLVAISPVLLVILCLPMLDVLVLKLIFGKKKK